MITRLIGIGFILALSAILPIVTYLRASIVVVRPSIFPILLGGGMGSPGPSANHIQRVVAEAARVLRLRPPRLSL